jgi:hypothetical protein
MPPFQPTEKTPPRRFFHFDGAINVGLIVTCALGFGSIAIKIGEQNQIIAQQGAAIIDLKAADVLIRADVANNEKDRIVRREEFQRQLTTLQTDYTLVKTDMARRMDRFENKIDQVLDRLSPTP